MEIMGTHPSGIYVRIRQVGDLYVYRAKYNDGRSKNLEITKRLAVLDSLPADYPMSNIEEEIKFWIWRYVEIKDGIKKM
ncbi:Uncharacterised protein [Listeria fleischmannii subsp. fleischmannii]|uniref:Uncharacterized protein n=2 Tax=Listeria fleischmannii TaxID=1069827 RepID=A0A2X3J873_9LIST|nr:hypothetical protein [Listeria fleischmannii]SQC70420.1 Uncharacterised protein [Listeria fleischmannii subsp. fleischmannii]